MKFQGTKKNKFYLYKIRLNSQGYTSTGRYFGVGIPLYYYESVDNTSISEYIRAYDRQHAKQQILSKVPNATFYN